MRSFVSVVLLAGLASPLAAQSSLVGYVRDNQSLRAIPGVDLTVDGFDKKVRTNKEGKYEIRDVPSGAQHVRLHVDGFSPFDTVMTFGAGEKAERVFFLARSADADATSRASSNAGSPTFEGFAERKRLGFGKFLDSEMLRQNAQRRLADLIETFAAVRVIPPLSCQGSRPLYCDWRVAVGRATEQQSTCTLEVRLNGQISSRSMVISGLTTMQDQSAAEWARAFDLNQFSPGALAAVEVYRAASEVPMSFGTTGTPCGLIAIWTRM